MINIDGLVVQYGLYNTSGKDLDFILKLILFTLKDYPRQYKIVFDMVTYDPNLWKILAMDADEVFEKEELLIAEYKACQEYPFYRVYCYKYSEINALSKEAFTSIINKKLETKDGKELYYRYNSSEINKQYKLWEENLIYQFKGLINVSNGRIENTKIDKIIILHRQPKGCIVCGKRATGYISTTIMNEQAIFIIAHTCDEHQEIAKKNPSFLHFLSTLFPLGIDFLLLNMQTKIDKKIIELIISEIKRDLHCKLINNDYNKSKDEFTLTFKRNSGVIVILRLHTLMDYAYVVNRPNGKYYKRIDSAPDHKDIQFFPDHFHNTIEKNKKPDVESSYTFGFPLLDLPAIEKMINNLENEESLT